ncbi:hypothetical protein PC110_g13158 [Phytophthora cactorum]|uniref:Uncharacterized protein n=1 Tax=Phytophthora cactorum TaxID=29920 RepID=A0A329S0Q4_9STRA|nr:hypothetical protein PC110_g13158 [Phytophthora cactorum]
MKLIRQFEEEEDGKYAAAAMATQPMFKQESTQHHDGSPTVGQTTTAQTLTQGWRQTVESPSAKPAPSKPVDLRTKAAVQPRAVKRSKQAARKPSQIDVLRFPQAKPRPNQRKKKKQARLETSSKPQKLAAIVLPDKRVPCLSRVLEWASNTNDRCHVSELLASYPVIMDDDFMGARSARCQRSYVCADDYDYNFVILKNLVTKLDAVVEAEKMKRKGFSYFGNDSESDHPDVTIKEIIAFFPGGTPKFTRFVACTAVLFVMLLTMLLVMLLVLTNACCVASTNVTTYRLPASVGVLNGPATSL